MGNSPAFKDDPGRERRGGRNHVTTNARDKHDVLGVVPGRRAANQNEIREVRCDPRRDGRRVVTRIPQQLLSQAFKTPNS